MLPSVIRRSIIQRTFNNSFPLITFSSDDLFDHLIKGQDIGKTLLRKDTKKANNLMENHRKQKLYLELTSNESNLNEGKQNVHSIYQPNCLNYSQLQIAELQHLRCNHFVVACFNLDGDKNTGTIIRSASSLGCSEVYIFGNHKYDRRSAVGTQHHSTVHCVMKDTSESNDEAFTRVMKDNNYVPIFLEQGGEDLMSFNWKKSLIQAEASMDSPKICIVVGNESYGIPRSILAKHKQIPGSAIVSIPMLGLVRSLNVSVAAGMAMYDIYQKMVWPLTRID
jgi:tRNA G18 (ribose-2'-O)-methylase SpoU